MKIIVTRPRQEANVWVKQLRELAFNAVVLPLIDISAPADISEVCDAWKNLHQYGAIMFVSSNAVRNFFANKSQIASAFINESAIKNEAKVGLEPNLPRMWATGPGTRDALLAQSVSSHRIDSPAIDAVQFDSEALWRLVQHQLKAGDKVLIVRGTTSDSKHTERVGMNGRPWLAEQLTAVGVDVHVVISYVRSQPQFSVAEHEMMARAATDKSIWLLSSSEALTNLKRISSMNLSEARAVATHPRIALSAREAGFGVVYESRPLFEDVVTSIKSIV